ncbi:MAG: hypothetical protein ACTTH7_02800 [Treponema sp.]
MSLKNAERILCRGIATLSAFKAWVELLLNSGLENHVIEQSLLQMYVLEEEKRFAEFKYTATQNPSGTIYYDWAEILGQREIKGKE